MAIPSFKLSTDTTAEGYAKSTASFLRIESVLFDGHVLEFLAYLTDMSQTFTSTWNSENVFGRNDPIGIFQGTVRTINLGFNVVAGNADEATLNTDKLGVLASFLYPSYKQNIGKGLDAAGQIVAVPMGTSHLYGSPLVRVKFANLIDNNLGGGGDGLLGWIGSLSINPVIDNGTFIVGQNHYPKSFDISFDLNVLHDKTPGYNEFGGWQGNDYFFGGDRVFVEGQVLAEKLQQKGQAIANAAGNVAGGIASKVKSAGGSVLKTIKGFGSMGSGGNSGGSTGGGGGNSGTTGAGAPADGGNTGGNNSGGNFT